jgi:hypothetical protein
MQVRLSCQTPWLLLQKRQAGKPDLHKTRGGQDDRAILSAQLNRDLEIGPGRKVYLLKGNPFILGVCLRDVAGPKDKARRPLLAQRTSIGSERNPDRLGAAARRPLYRIGDRLDPVSGL